jgi:hypothetical protein
MPVKPVNRIIVIFTILFSAFFAGRFLMHKTTFYGDSGGYYLYLPQTFIYHNLTNYQPYPRDREIPAIALNYESANPVRNEKDTLFNQYTYAVALFESPFFFMAHAYELITGGNANGYNTTYEFFIKLSSIFYTILGLILVYKILRRFFDETPSLLATVLLLLGTNLFWFTIFQTGMSHPQLFLFFAATGLLVGFITIMRPTDIVCLIIPLFYNVYNKETFQNKIAFLRANVINIVVAAALFIIPIIPQLLYWKAMSGHYIYYSYKNQSFIWNDPKIVEGMFHFSNGWLAYSPLMFFSLFGMFFLRKIKKWAIGLWLLLPLYIYIIYSWYCYTYINGLGSRPMLHMYPFLAIPLTAFISFILHRAVWLRFVFAAIVIFCCVLNIDYSNRQRLGILWSEESSFEFNLQTMFRSTLRYDDLVVNDIKIFQPDTAKLVKLCTYAIQQYNDSVSDQTIPDPVSGHKYVYYQHNEEYPKISISVPYNKQQFADAKWIKWSGRFMCTQHPDYFRHLLVADIGGKLWAGCKIENKNFTWLQSEHNLDHLTLFDYKLNIWGPVYFFTKIPKNIDENDILKLFVWIPNKQEIYIDDLKIELYK